MLRVRVGLLERVTSYHKVGTYRVQVRVGTWVRQLLFRAWLLKARVRAGSGLKVQVQAAARVRDEAWVGVELH